MKNNTFKDPSYIAASRRGPAAEKAIRVLPKVADHIQKCEAMAVGRDPYYIHMPKDDPAKAAIYAAKMGGEHNEASECEIM